MQRRKTLIVILGVLPLAVTATYSYADITVTQPYKPWHVTEITASLARCDSPTTFAYEVSWKPVFYTWNPERTPFIWPHYKVKTYNCAATSVIYCQTHCVVRATQCSIRQPASWMRIQTYLNEELTSIGSWMQIGGILRPKLTWDGGWKCPNPSPFPEYPQ